MVPLNSPLTKKVIFNTSRRTYYMTAFYPKLHFHACKQCFVLYHDEALCKEFQMRIYVRALPAPSPRATHVVVTKVVTNKEKGESSHSSGPSKSFDVAASPNEHSKPSAFSVSLQPSRALTNRGSSLSLPVSSSVFPVGLVHDRKGKRSRTAFESVYLSFSTSSSMMPTPH